MIITFLTSIFGKTAAADDGFKITYPRVVVPRLNAPTFGPPPGQNIANAIIIAEALRQRNAAEVQQQEIISRQETQRKGLITFLANFQNAIITLKRLSDRIPAPHPGLLGAIEAYIMELKTKWGYEIYVKEYDRFLKANGFLDGIAAFPDPVHDTFNYRAISWFRIIDGYNQAVHEFSSEFGYVGEKIDIRKIMSVAEYGIANLIYGKPLQELTDDELKAAFNGDMSSISVEKIESAKEECQRRKMVCGNVWSDLNYITRKFLNRFEKVDRQNKSVAVTATAQPLAQEAHTKYNSRTGQTFPERYQYDPTTGEKLFHIR